MIRYECDMCGVRMSADCSGRFIVKMEVFAADGPIDLDTEPSTDTRGALQAVIEQLRHADPNDIEDRTYRAFRFDVCDACRAKLIAAPLPR